jgi:regulatory protein
MTEREKVITAIEVQKRNKNRVNIYIDGEFTFSCSAELVYTHGLKNGKTVVRRAS